MKNNLSLFIAALLFTMLSCSTEKALLKEFKSADPAVLVCPVHILSNQNSSYDTISSLRIAEYLNENNYANARLTNYYPPPNNTWQRNEAKMLTISIELFSDYVKTLDLPENTYILYPEFLKSGIEPKVRAVHYCLLNHDGELVIRGLLNSLWKEFQSVNPVNNEDCVSVFKNGFDDYMES